MSVYKIFFLTLNIYFIVLICNRKKKDFQKITKNTCTFDLYFFITDRLMWRSVKFPAKLRCRHLNCIDLPYMHVFCQHSFWPSIHRIKFIPKNNVDIYMMQFCFAYRWNHRDKTRECKSRLKPFSWQRLFSI